MRGSVEVTRQAHNLEDAGPTPAPAFYGLDIMQLRLRLRRKDSADTERLAGGVTAPPATY